MPILAAAAPLPPSTHTGSDEKVSQGSMAPITTPVENVASSSIPIVSLDCDVITDSVAATLAMSLIGHVLFLKSQIPLPVVQLSRLSNSKSTPRALKQRNELLSSFDTLASHLNTTFTALSSAFARIRATSKGNTDHTEKKGDRERVYMGIFVGSSTSSAKAKAMFAVDGLEIKAIGARDDIRKGGDEVEDGDEGEEDLTGSEAGDEEQEEIANDEGENDGDEDDDDEEADEEDDEDEAEAEDENPSSPPDSRSPSPEPPRPSHAEQQRTLQMAERLLARTLAAADAEGHGMSADLAPTQTHILLRAPRRFDHPAWIPRQNISSALENTLDDFLEESGIISSEAEKPKKSQRKRKAAEGVWIVGQKGLDTKLGKDLVPSSGEEWDEMIWWSWDGKIVGFSDW